MDHRLKERLTGAVILVALIVLLVPEMFHGQSGNIAASVGNSAEGPPLRSYTIDLSNGAARTAPLQSTALAAASPADEHASQPAAPPSSSTGGPGSVTEAPAASAAAASRGAPVSAPAPKALEHVAATGWSVQLGLFSQRDNAQRLVHAAQAKGFAVSLANPDGNGPYRVRAAGLADRAAALALQQRLRTQGFAAAIVAP
jgi:rare lipoprotein A